MAGVPGAGAPPGAVSVCIWLLNFPSSLAGLVADVYRVPRVNVYRRARAVRPGCFVKAVLLPGRHRDALRGVVNRQLRRGGARGQLYGGHIRFVVYVAHIERPAGRYRDRGATTPPLLIGAYLIDREARRLFFHIVYQEFRALRHAAQHGTAEFRAHHPGVDEIPAGEAAAVGELRGGFVHAVVVAAGDAGVEVVAACAGGVATACSCISQNST